MARDPYHTRPGDAQAEEKPPRQKRRLPLPNWLADVLEAVAEFVVDLVCELFD